MHFDKDVDKNVRFVSWNVCVDVYDRGSKHTLWKVLRKFAHRFLSDKFRSSLFIGQIALTIATERLYKIFQERYVLEGILNTNRTKRKLVNKLHDFDTFCNFFLHLK